MSILNNGQSRNSSSKRRGRLSDGPSFDESVSQDGSSTGHGSSSESSSVFSDCEYSTYDEEDDDDDDEQINNDSGVDASISQYGSSRKTGSGSESSIFSGSEFDTEEYEDFDGSRSCVDGSVFSDRSYVDDSVISDSDPEIDDEYESSTAFFGIRSMTDAIKNIFNMGRDELFESDDDDDIHHDTETESVSLHDINNDDYHDIDNNRHKRAVETVASHDKNADDSPHELDIQPDALDNHKVNGRHELEKELVASDDYEENGCHRGDVISVLWVSQKDGGHHTGENELGASHVDNGHYKIDTESVLKDIQKDGGFIHSANERVSSDDDEDDRRHIADILSISEDDNDGQYDSEKDLDAWFMDRFMSRKAIKRLGDSSSWDDESPSKGGTAPSTHFSESSRERSSDQVKHSISSPPSDDSCFDGCESHDTSQALEDAGFVGGVHPRGDAEFPRVIHSINPIATPFDESYDGDWSDGEQHGEDENSISFHDDDFNKKERTVGLASSIYKIPEDITFTKSKPTRQKKAAGPRFRVTVVQRDAPTQTASIIRESAG